MCLLILLAFSQHCCVTAAVPGGGICQWPAQKFDLTSEEGIKSASSPTTSVTGPRRVSSFLMCAAHVSGGLGPRAVQSVARAQMHKERVTPFGTELPVQEQTHQGASVGRVGLGHLRPALGRDWQ